MTVFDPGPLEQVDCVRDDERWTLVFIRDLRHAPEKVWAALTDPGQVGQWAPYTADRDLGRSGDVTLTMIDGEASTEIAATVIRAERPTLLEYTWGTDLLRWELAPAGVGTRLTLRHTVQDRELAPKVAAGWHLCLVVADRLLAGEPIPPIRGMAAKEYGWDRLNEGYAEKLDIPLT
ncbi:SRPBCC family protein [Streptosporangiaceae bacterium NEAU-GS5]|nr:SRPBCC family protein [Streptosporangiaceae bacterium NEAU-GS5]